jgi:hypothetical protein
MPRLVNDEITQMLSDIKQAEQKATQALYNQFKALTKIVNTDSYEGTGADSYKEYVSNVDINYLNSFLNLTKETSAALSDIQTTFTSFESESSGIVGSGTLGDTKESLANKKSSFSDLVSEIEAVNIKAEEYITIKKISSSEVESDYDSIIKSIETIKSNLSTSNSTALSKADSLYQRIQELKNCVDKISSEYHNSGRIDYQKAKQITSEKWYTVEEPVALTEVAMNDPYSYEVFGDTGAEAQWARGLDTNIYGMLYAKVNEYKARVEKGDFYRGMEAEYTGVGIGGRAKVTDFFNADGNASLINANMGAKVGFNNDYKGASINGDISLAKADACAVLGTDNFNGCAKASVDVLSASGHAEFEFEEDSFAIGLGGKASGVNASASAGLSFLEYDTGDEKGNIFGVQVKPEFNAGASAEFSLSGQRAVSFGPIDINAVSLNLGGSLGFGLELGITLPIPSINFGWEL